MSFDKLKNLFSRTFDSRQEDSLLSQASNFISSSRRSIAENPTAQFDSYLQSLPIQQLKLLKGVKQKTNRTASLRPQLVKRCYENVPQIYFDNRYEIKGELFTRSRKQTGQMTGKMHEQLDEIQLCLYNQISSRFDEILSVLRTIESLQCLVVYNAQRLGGMRKSNMQLAKEVSMRHLKIVGLLKRKERLESVISKLNQIKVYQQFIQVDASNLKLQRSNSQMHHQINEIRGKRELYFQLKATKEFEERVEQFQSTLKRSYSDSINDAFFKYVTGIVPYDVSFWQKKFMGRSIFQEDQVQQGTVILDESVLVEEEGPGGFNIKLVDQSQFEIIQNLISGWREGEYNVGNIKAAFDKFCKEKHLRFLSQCRNYCFQNYLRQDRKKIQNPSIANLMQQMNINFCSRTFTYYADVYRTLISRTFSLVHRGVQALLDESLGEISIEQKQKLAGVVDGLFSIVVFVFKTVYEKILEVIELKIVHDSMELNDFKVLINVLETEEEFIDKQIGKYMSFKVNSASFLEKTVAEHIARLNAGMVTKAKQDKVLSFLNKTHRFIIQNQLRDSFQNQIWQATDIPTFYYDSLHYLITGESLNLRRNKSHTVRFNASNMFQSSVFIDRLGQETSMMAEGSKLMGNFRIIRNQIIIQSKVYKVTETLLLMLQIIEDYLHLAQFYPFAQKEAGVKIFQLIRAYSTSSSQLIIYGGAVKLQKIKTKNITAKHLALSSLCLSFLQYIMVCISKRVPIYQQQKLRKQIQAQQQTTIKKLTSILSTKINQFLPEITLANTPSKGTQSIVNNTKTLHDILIDFFQKQVLAKIFTRDNTKAYLSRMRGLQVSTKMQAESLKDDINFYFHQLRFLLGVVLDFEELRMQGQDIIRVKFQQL